MTMKKVRDEYGEQDLLPEAPRRLASPFFPDILLPAHFFLIGY